MLEAIGTGLVVPNRPQVMVRAFAIRARMTGQDILDYFQGFGRTVEDIAITDPDLIRRITRLPVVDQSGNANLVIQDEKHALSFTKVIRVVRDNANLRSRIPWVSGRVFALVPNPVGL